jgi:hypothetical protein
MNEQRMPTFSGFLKLQLQNTFREYHRLLFPQTHVGFEKNDEAFISKSGLFRLMLFSSFCLAVSFLLVRALSILILTGLLTLNEINHIYSVFNIYYLSGDDSHWSDGSLLIIYGLPNLAFLAAGMYLTSFTIRIRKLNWIFRLFLAWIAFNLITFFQSELIIALFFYKGLGIPLQWLISQFYIRIIIIITGIIGIVFWSKRFGLLFLRCSPSRIFTDDISVMKTWLIWVVIIPLFTGSAYLLFILFFSLKISLATMFISAMISLPLAYRSINYLPYVRIYKSKKIIPGFVFTMALMLIFGTILRLLIMWV